MIDIIMTSDCYWVRNYIAINVEGGGLSLMHTKQSGETGEH